ncbi:ferredoxin-type protein NapF [Tahibacter sp. UC22_41]|uniref:ferredoxin-type protein NapF n=1 Tax=Tahibacter sp. UC22_41 TaxID=3350178 RepID=UPI0036DC2A73
MSAPFSPSRRALLFGRSEAAPAPRPFRPPWARPEPEFTAACTRCDACIRQCPQHVLVRGADGLPRFDPRAGECTFCGNCVSACTQGAFDRSRDPPWSLLAQVADTCLSALSIVCTSCRETCPTSAIRIPPAARGAASVDASRCTGCGACVSVCPVDAISLHHAEIPEVVA